jgi:hypothetical protein
LEIQQGSPGLADLAYLWRAGNAGDTIAVVIISELPVYVTLRSGEMTDGLGLRRTMFNPQKYLILPTCTSLLAKKCLYVKKHFYSFANRKNNNNFALFGSLMATPYFCR